MIPYLILLFTVSTIAYAGRRHGSKSVQYLSLGIIMLLLTLFAGLRYRLVGTDTGTYIRHFISVNSFSDIWRTTEVGYNILMVLAKSLSDNYASILTLIALIIVSCYVSTIVRLTKRYETAIFLFITLGAYTFFFNGARQGIAAAICFLAIPWLLERKPKQYFLLIGLAFTFHHTALIAAPLYYLAKNKVDWKQLVIIIAGIILLYLVMFSFVELAASLFKDQYAYYAKATEGGGRVTTFFLVSQGIALYLLRPIDVEHSENYHRLLSIYLIGLVPAVSATAANMDPSTVIRLHLYFSSTAILLWPMVFMNWKNTPQKFFISIGFAVFLIVYFILTTTSFSHLVPYQINQSIF